jgi:hypothetical protein
MNEIERLRRLRAYVSLSREAVDLWNDIRTFAQYVTALKEVSKKDYDFYKRFIRDFRRRIESLAARLRGVRLLYQLIDPDELKRARVIIVKRKRYRPEKIFEPFLALLVDILDIVEEHLEKIKIIKYYKSQIEVKFIGTTPKSEEYEVGGEPKVFLKMRVWINANKAISERDLRRAARYVLEEIKVRDRLEKALTRKKMKYLVAYEVEEIAEEEADYLGTYQYYAIFRTGNKYEGKFKLL